MSDKNKQIQEESNVEEVSQQAELQNEKADNAEVKSEIVVETEEENQLVRMVDSTNLLVEGRRMYELVMNYRDGFDSDKLAERYSEILSKYDYIVADWGFDQLRLKGFYDDKNRKVPQEQRIGSLQDYLYEFCNFGCAYFVLRRTGGRKEKTVRPKRPRSRNTNNAASANIAATNNSSKEIPTSKNKKNYAGKSNYNGKNKAENQRSGTKNTKKKFVTKRVQEKNEQSKIDGKKNELKPAVETVKEKNGQRHFNIRRNDVEKVKNKE